MTVLMEDRVRDPDPPNSHPLGRDVRQRDDEAGDDYSREGIVASAEAFGNAAVRAVADAVHPPGVTRADLDELLGVLRGIRDNAADELAARRLKAHWP